MMIDVLFIGATNRNEQCNKEMEAQPLVSGHRHRPSQDSIIKAHNMEMIHLMMTTSHA